MNAVERWLSGNRGTIALFVPFVGAVGFAVQRYVELPALETALRSPLLLVAANLAMALPLAAGLWPVLGRRGIIALASVALFSYVIEGVGVETGVPYGRFSYALGLEPLLFGRVPLPLPLFWVPMVLNASLLALASARPDVSRITIWLRAVLALVLLDGVLDPGAVGLGFWGWDEPGRYYGVPLQNFVGWMLSGGIAMAVMSWGADRAAWSRRLRQAPWMWDTLRAFLVFWGLINALLGQWAPVVLAAALWGGQGWATRHDKQ